MTGDKIVTRILITAVLCGFYICYITGYDNGVVKGWVDESAFDRCIHEQLNPLDIFKKCQKNDR